MNRFLWLLRREVWEHKAIWVAPLIVIGCLMLMVLTGNVHLGPIGDFDSSSPLGSLPSDVQVRLLLIVYAGLALVMGMVMGVIAFFYALDSLYSDRRDRSVLFWKSLPLSDVETVMSKFAVAAIVMPLVAVAAAIVAQFVIAAGGSLKLMMAGMPAGFMWQPEAIFGGISVAFLWCVTAILWYAPVIGYLMLASAWAPKGPFLWAVLPPVGLWILERVVAGSEHVGDFITERLFGLYGLIGHRGDQAVETGQQLKEEIIELSNLDPLGSLREFYASPDLWLGVVAAALLLAAAIWVRRYRDETS
ncbi:MAG TPA: ABC-2 transporter permease [Steroidobacteraceae bacterium]|nr:ABC-2 transporter permease [Steroidobacteraceae bacterium]